MTTAQVLHTELGNIIQESKRKNVELRNAAERSLNNLKSLPSTSETQYAADLRRRATVVETFIIACQSRISKAIYSGVTCLQRLIVSNGLPEELLEKTLNVFQDCASAPADVQLKILQSLPPLFQNYGGKLQDTLVASVLQTCVSLQQSKISAVSNTASATLQQAITFIFEKVGGEDEADKTSVSTKEFILSTTRLRIGCAAFDASEILRDLCYIVDGQQPRFIRKAILPPEIALELLESIVANYGTLINEHVELSSILEEHLVPPINRLLAGSPSFIVSVRLARVLCLLLRNHYLEVIQYKCNSILLNLNHFLISDKSVAWRRALYIEVFRFIYSDETLVVTIFDALDVRETENHALKSNLDIFVRIAAEKPNLIGVGLYSTEPSNVASLSKAQQEHVEAGRAVGLDGDASTGTSANAVGISAQSSSMRVPYLEQTDKAEAPQPPETYIYSLVLTCVNSVSESLARIILPATIRHQTKSARRRKNRGESSARLEQSDDVTPSSGQETQSIPSSRRSQDKSTPPNLLELDEGEELPNIKVVADLINICWPALLAIESTFLYASLDANHYRSLVRACQKFAQVSGLLRLSTPRDAFLTTLSKAAVPSKLLQGNSLKTAGDVDMTTKPRGLQSPSTESFFSQKSTDSQSASRRGSLDFGRQNLTQRNLMCLRALVNLAVALGPIFGQAWQIVLECIQKAHVLLAVSNNATIARDNRSNNHNGELDTEEVGSSPNLASEISAVENAVSRLFQSTAEYPDAALQALLQHLCSLVSLNSGSSREIDPAPGTPTLQTPPNQKRASSISGVAASLSLHPQYNQFVLARLGDIASANIQRMNEDPNSQIWSSIMTFASRYAATPVNEDRSRLMAAQVVTSVAVDSAVLSRLDKGDLTSDIRGRCLKILANGIAELHKESMVADTKALSSVGIEVQKTALESLKLILEQIGDTLQTHWEVCFELVESVFITSKSSNSDGQSTDSDISHSIAVISPSLLRSAFSSLQLICSDFLTNVPARCLALLPRILTKFTRQTQDLNIALTTVSLFSSIASFACEQLEIPPADSISHDDLSYDVNELRTATHAEAMQGSPRAIWMNLLHALVELSSDTAHEVRKSVIQTALRALDDSGDQLKSTEWNIVLHTVILALLHSDTKQLEGAFHSSSPKELEPEQESTSSSKLLMDGVARLIANYMGLICGIPEFTNFWRELLKALSQHIKYGSVDLSATTLTCLTTILTAPTQLIGLDEQAIDMTASLWAFHADHVVSLTSEAGDGIEHALIAYVAVGTQVYRLSKSRMTIEKTSTIMQNLEKCITASSARPYETDVDRMSPLQIVVLDFFSDLLNDRTGEAARIIDSLARFIKLPAEQAQRSSLNRSLTFVAFAKRAMHMTQAVFLTHAQSEMLYTSEHVTLAMTALVLLVENKYKLKSQGQEPSLWRTAVTTALTVLDKTLGGNPNVRTKDVAKSRLIASCWPTVARLSTSIRRADCEEELDNDMLLSDENFDLQSSSTLRRMMQPLMKTRAGYHHMGKQHCHDLFYSSMIHTPPRDEPLPELDQNPLDCYSTMRRGRVYEPDFNPRIRMCYYCFDELFDLVSMPFSGSSLDDEQSSNDNQYAIEDLRREAFKYLLARCALPIKTYIVDQPLRSRLPMMMSQLLELLYVLRRLRELRCHYIGHSMLSDTHVGDARMPAFRIRNPEKEHLEWILPLVTHAVQIQSFEPELDEAFQALVNEAIA